MRHLCILILPMLYMIIYVKYQADADDAKEVSPGVLALLFAFAEFCRTVVGLWQLHVFRHWAVGSIRSLQSPGYLAERRIGNKDEETNDGEDDDDDSDTQDLDNGATDLGGRSASRTKKSQQELRDPFEIADGLIINDLVVDNRLSEGEIECFLRLRNSAQNPTWRQRLRASTQWASCNWYFPRLLVTICRSREPLFTSPASAIYLKPYDAEDIWILWACVLVAQLFPAWLEDMQKSGMSDMSSKDGLKEQLALFRRGVLCSAALHTQSSIHPADSEEITTPASGAAGHSLLDFRK